MSGSNSAGAQMRAAQMHSRDDWIAKFLEINATERLSDAPEAQQLLCTSFDKRSEGEVGARRHLWIRGFVVLGLAAAVLWIWPSVVLIGPILRRFVENYPDIQLEITAEDRPVDIVADGCDAGIRYGGTVPQDMVAVALTERLRWVVAGSPDYLAHHGRPELPQDLLRHFCVRMRLGDNSLYRWELGNGAEACEIDVSGPLSANDTETSVQAAVNGVGLVYCLERRISEELREGRLEVVLPEWAALGPPFFMYYPSRRQTQPGLRQLVEVIRAVNLTKATELSRSLGAG